VPPQPTADRPSLFLFRENSMGAILCLSCIGDPSSRTEHPMNQTAILFVSLGAVSGALAVMMGAFGAHGLRERLSEEMLSIYKTGVEYHFYHTLALLVVGLVAQHCKSALLTASGWSMTAGIVIFSGSLYALSISGIRILGAVTPIGGVLFVVGWALLAVAVLKAG
jgi:uncharacterized membrane protein YgdD (TMEM256/DUF423 family)